MAADAETAQFARSHSAHCEAEIEKHHYENSSVFKNTFVNKKEEILTISFLFLILPVPYAAGKAQAPPADWHPADTYSIPNAVSVLQNLPPSAASHMLP